MKYSYNYKKNILDYKDLNVIIDDLVKKLRDKGFVVNANNNNIDFNFKPRFILQTGENRIAAMRLLRHGSINVIETQDSFQILCKYDLNYLMVMATLFGLAIFGLNIFLSDNNVISNSFLLFLIVFGFIFGIGMIFLWFKVNSLIKIK